ncbi:MAG: hypothetical protein QOI95_4421 [Acidimicrobiaceae bacterium]
MIVDCGDGVRRGLEELATAGRRKDELGSAVGRIGAALDVAESVEIVDQLRACGEAELRPFGKLRQSDSTPSDVAEHLQVRDAQAGKQRWVVMGHQLGAEVLEQTVEDLPRRAAFRVVGS